MRYVRGTVLVLLIVSVAINVIAYVKLRGTRPIFSVNGTGYSKRDLDTYLENQAGPVVKAHITEQLLTEQAADAQHLMPTDKEVNDEFNTQRELNWQFAMKAENNPWYADTMKEQIKLALCQQRLRTKDVQVSDDEIKSEYNSRPSVYDMPNKARTELALIKDPAIINDVTQLMSSNPPVNPATIREKYAPNLLFIGDRDVFTFVQPFGDVRTYSNIFSMKPGDVLGMPPTQDLAQQGIKKMVVRMIQVTPGHKADLNDPETRSKIQMNVALRRSRPWQEILSQLWANARFESEDPRDRRYIEQQFFPDRAASS